MNILKFIKENIFKIKPIFKIEIKESWFSKDWVYIRYSSNNGWNWYVIVEETIDADENKWDKYKVETRYVKITCIEDFMKYNDLSSFEKCEQFCEKIYDWVREHNERAYSEYVKKVNPGRNFVEKFNNK